jgi:hypothetical protein
MHVLGAGAWSCSRFQRAGALLSFPLNAFVLNCAAKARRCDRAGARLTANQVQTPQGGNFGNHRLFRDQSGRDERQRRR